MGSPIIFNGTAAKLLTRNLKIPDATTNSITLGTPSAVTTYSLVLPNAQGGASTFLQNDGSGNLSWASASGTTPTSSSDVINLGLQTSVASNILTVALKQQNGTSDPAAGAGAVLIGMRNTSATSGGYNSRSVTAALSMTISSGTTLNLQNNVSQYLWVYAIDSDGAGTIKLGLSIILLDDGSLQSVVNESFTAAISNASPAVITATAHGLNNNDSVRFTTTGALPAGLSTGVTYWVINKAANTFQVAAQPRGTAINTSSAGSGTHTAHIVASNGQIVSNAVYSSVAVRLIARIAITEAATGTWASNATEVSVLESFNASSYASAISCSYSLSANATPGANSVLVFDAVIWDSHNAYDPASGAGVFVAPKAGKYMVTAVGQTTGTGAAGIYIIKNGNNQSYIGQMGQTQEMSCSGTIALGTGDTLSFFIDAARTIQGGLVGSNFGTLMSIQSIGF